MLGCTNPNLKPLALILAAAEAAGKSGDALQQIEDGWLARAGICLFDEAVIKELKAANKGNLEEKYLNEVKKSGGIIDSREVAKRYLGKDVSFDWDAPRTREGYFRYQGGVKCAIMRGTAFAPYADLIWMESRKPDFQQAAEFADGIHTVWPMQKLAYNLSPSFNWKSMLPLLCLACGSSC